jgi:hypothetical protein
MKAKALATMPAAFYMLSMLVMPPEHDERITK